MSTALTLFDTDRPATWPTDDSEVVIEADWTARRDGYGRLLFFAWWWPGRFWNLDEPSAQAFYANPEEHAERWESEGKSLRVEQMDGAA